VPATQTLPSNCLLVLRLSSITSPRCIGSLAFGLGRNSPTFYVEVQRRNTADREGASNGTSRWSGLRRMTATPAPAPARLRAAGGRPRVIRQVGYRRTNVAGPRGVASYLWALGKTDRRNASQPHVPRGTHRAARRARGDQLRDRRPAIYQREHCGVPPPQRVHQARVRSRTQVVYRNPRDRPKPRAAVRRTSKRRSSGPIRRTRQPQERLGVSRMRVRLRRPSICHGRAAMTRTSQVPGGRQWPIHKEIRNVS
jgi:hypothetical protein